MTKPILTNEEKAGKKIEDILSDSRLDIEQMGTYFGRFAWYENIEKLNTMADAAVVSRNKLLENINQNVQPRTAKKLSGQDKLPKKVTSLDTKAEVLSEFWLNQRYEEEYADFFEYNDLGLPLAHAYISGYAELNEKSIAFVDEAFNMLLDLFEIDRNTVFKDAGEFQDLGLF